MNANYRRGLSALALLLALALPLTAHAQRKPVYQDGVIPPNHLVKQTTDGLIKDTGTPATGDAQGRGIAPIGITDALDSHGVCSYSANPTVAGTSLCLGHDASGNPVIAVDSVAGAAQKGLNVLINGSLTSWPPTAIGSGNVVGPNTTTINDLMVWNNTGGTAAKDGAGANISHAGNLGLSAGTLTITPATALGSGLLTVQVPTGASAVWTAVNEIKVNPDNATITSGAAPYNSLQALRINHTYGGSAMQGGRNSLTVQSYFSGASNSANVNRNYVGIFNIETAATGDGGAAGACSGAGGFATGGNCFKGAFFASNPYAAALNGAGYLFELAGMEVDVEAQAGSGPIYYKAGVSIAQMATDQVQGSSWDCALCFSNAAGAIGWKNLISIGTMNGQTPVASTGSILGTAGSATLVSGFDISSYTFTGYAWKSPGVSISGTGNTIIKTGATADSTGQPPGTYALEVYNATSLTGQGGLFVKNNWGASSARVLEVGNDVPAGAYAPYLTVFGDGRTVALSLVAGTSSPASGAACTQGQLTSDTGFFYACTATGVWKRVALTGGY